MSRVVAAVDLGASSGRVIAGVASGDEVRLDELHRFAIAPVQRAGHLRWDLDAICDEVLDGLTRLVTRYPQVESIGVDTWAVDYALLDADGQLIDDPISYRDDRTAAAIDEVHELVDAAELFEINGLQFLPFTSIYQLVADRHTGRLDGAHTAVLLADLLVHRLTGELASESTNVSTTGAFDVRTRQWSGALLHRLGLGAVAFPPLVAPGTRRGSLLPDVAARLGVPHGVQVTTVASHDTASAVAALPVQRECFAYVISGTWSLVGVELPEPDTSDAARGLGFTNELGLDGRTRLLRNVGGLWLLEECRRVWGDDTDAGRTALLDAASRRRSGGPTFDVTSVDLIAPGDMPDRIRAMVHPDPLETDAAVARCVLDSLAAAYASAIDAAASLIGRPIEVVHVAGGGSRNELLCQLTADATGLPVVAGPVEATALGNVLVQLRAIGAAPSTLDELRRWVTSSTELRHHAPSLTTIPTGGPR